MTTTPTQNPVPSESPIDLKFNAGKIDEFVTSLAEIYVDRLGNSHYTIEGLKQLALQQIYNLGWNLVGTFQEGATLDSAGDVIQDETTNIWYRWDDLATLPKTVESGSTPESSGGTGPGKWQPVDINDALRRELAEDSSQVSIAGESAEDVAQATRATKIQPQYPHAKTYSSGNEKIRAVLAGESCSLEGGNYSITEQLIFSGNKNIVITRDTVISIDAKVDQPIKFTGKIRVTGPGRLSIKVNMNDKADGTESVLLFTDYIPDLECIDIFDANGACVLVGRTNFNTTSPTGKGGGVIDGIGSFNCGKGVHVYGNPNKDTFIITKNLRTDALTGKNGGNILYLSFHKYAKNIGGYFQCDPSSTGSPNINKSVYGFYEGGVWDGTYRGPTFGEDLEYGAITGGWVSRGCAFSAISTDIRKADGSYPVSRLLVTDGQAIGCNRTLYCQAQDVKIGNIHTTGSTSTDFLFRINGATPVSVKQVGVITVFDSVNSPSIFNLAEGSRVDLKRSMIFTDLTSITLPLVAGDPSFINDGSYFPLITEDYTVSNLQEKLVVNLASAAAVTTIRLPASTFSNIRGGRLEVFVYGGNGSKILRFTVHNGAGTINGSTASFDVTPAAGAVRKIDIYGFGSAGAYLLAS